MFGRKKKAMAEYASGLAKIINVLFEPLRQLHGGELPPEVPTDKFILGYIAGVVTRGAHAAGFTGPTDGDDITVQVYEMFFP